MSTMEPLGPAELQRKVRQLDNDVGAIYGILYDMRIWLERHDNRFEELSVAQERLEKKVDTGFASIEAKLDRLLSD